MDMTTESSMFSQGALEQVMNIVNPGEIEMMLKNENLYKELLPGDIFGIDQEVLPHLGITFDSNQPDSTQTFNEKAISSISTSALPSTADYSGPCEFDVEVGTSSDKKKRWEYSASLKKLFVIMEGKIPMQFKWNQSEYGLYVRVLPVYLGQDSFSQAVLRCPTHSSDKNMSNKDFQFVDHVIRSDHPHALYDKNADSKRLSILVPLDPPQAGVDWTTVIFMFMCKNSCGLGMNRRSTALIFTLERPNGEVIGRKMLKMRICSCPRRDMVKEEKDAIAKPLNEEEDEAAEVADKSKDLESIIVGGKRPLKRLSHDIVNFQIRLPKMYVAHVAKIVRQTVLMKGEYRELTAEENFALIDCNKYIQCKQEELSV